MNETTLTATHAVEIAVDGGRIAADVTVPKDGHGVIVFAHGSGSSRFSPRNRAVATALQRASFATVLADLLTSAEAAEDEMTGRLRFDIPLLARRVIALLDWLSAQPGLRDQPVGLFGASTGAAAALSAAAVRPDRVGAVVSRGGRPDLADQHLPQVRAPTLLIVGGNDTEVIRLNRLALVPLTCEALLAIVPGATHLFEETGALEQVTAKATAWFQDHLVKAAAS